MTDVGMVVHNGIVYLRFKGWSNQPMPLIKNDIDFPEKEIGQKTSEEPMPSDFIMAFTIDGFKKMLTYFHEELDKATSEFQTGSVSHA